MFIKFLKVVFTIIAGCFLVFTLFTAPVINLAVGAVIGLLLGPLGKRLGLHG